MEGHSKVIPVNARDKMFLSPLHIHDFSCIQVHFILNVDLILLNCIILVFKWYLFTFEKMPYLQLFLLMSMHMIYYLLFL